MRQIKDRAELPTDFELSKYAATSSFGIADWVVNLEMRSLSAYMQSQQFRPDDQLVRCENILANPLKSIENFENYPGFSKFIYKTSVRDFEAIDFFWHGRECKTDGRQSKYLLGFDEFVDSSIPYLEKASNNAELVERMETPYYKMLEACGIRHDGDALVKIDLHNSDEKLMSDFASWLKATRTETNIAAPRKKFNADDFLSWSEGGILPYLDLTLWASANGLEITQQLLGTTIFPNEFSVNLAERIRKSTRPLAKLMTREVFTDALRSQALAEIAEQKSNKILPEKYAGS